MTLHLRRPSGPLVGSVVLSGSKSISNRVLAIRALSPGHFSISGLADAKDTSLMQQLLSAPDEILDAGAAGTTYRFLTALLSMREGAQILTGSERMKQRPIGLLVEALRHLGADIRYMEKEGYPPLRIGPPARRNVARTLAISAGISSQYISALLLIAPTLPQGLSMRLDGPVVSRPYIEMTLRLMEYFGIAHEWKGDTIEVAPQPYQPRDFEVEADWSAASYYYAMAALAPEADLKLSGLFEQSLQGDAVLVEMMRLFGVETRFHNGMTHLAKSGEASAPPVFEWDFLNCPDLAQTLAVVCAGTGVQGLLSGLETLRIKETDRIAALAAELKKTGVGLSAVPKRPAKKSGKEYFLVDGKAAFPTLPVFETYEDHRMAMAFAPLAMLAPIAIREPGVVEKSYPRFWKDIEGLGFLLQSGSTALV